MARKKRKPRRRGPRGLGSVFQRGDDVWVARGPGGKPEATGKTMAQARERLAEKIAELAGGRPPDENTTVAEWAARWVKDLTVRAGSRSDYTASVECHITPALGKLRMAKVTTAHVQEAITAWGKVLAASTVQKVIRHLSALFTAAVDARLIADNPVRKSKKPKVPKPRFEVYAPDQLVTILREAAATSNGVIATLAATGCRVGEALALDVADFDPAKRTLSITKTYELRWGIGPPKSENSVRTIDVPDELVPVLVKAAGARTAGPLFLNTRGNRPTASAVWDRWSTLIKRLGLPMRKPHALRHSVATMLVGAKFPIPDVAAYLGDTKETIVTNYLHDTKASPVGVLNELYGGLKVKNGPEAGKKR